MMLMEEWYAVKEWCKVLKVSDIWYQENEINN